MTKTTYKGTPPTYRHFDISEVERHLNKPDIAHFELAQSTDDPHQLAYWPSREAFDLGTKKRVRGKPGRILKKCIPDISDKDLNDFIDWFRERYITSSDELTLHRSTQGNEFKHAYTHSPADYTNPHTTHKRKSLANSCHRHSFAHLPYHPSEAYASGEFEIWYATDSEGYIHGRCVVHMPSRCAAPVYGVSETSLDFIENALKAADVSLAYTKDDPWVGAKLLAIEHDGGFVGPYLDMEPQAYTHSGSHLFIDRHGDIDGSDHEGILGENNSCCCDACDDRISEDDQFHTDGGTYCRDCVNYCEYYEEYTREGTETVYVNSRKQTEEWSPDARYQHASYCDDREEWWSNDCCTYVEDLQDYIPDHLLEEYGYDCCGDPLEDEEEEEEYETAA